MKDASVKSVIGAFVVAVGTLAGVVCGMVASGGCANLPPEWIPPAVTNAVPPVVVPPVEPEQPEQPEPPAPPANGDVVDVRDLTMKGDRKMWSPVGLPVTLPPVKVTLTSRGVNIDNPLNEWGELHMGWKREDGKLVAGQVDSLRPGQRYKDYTNFDTRLGSLPPRGENQMFFWVTFKNNTRGRSPIIYAVGKYKGG